MVRIEQFELRSPHTVALRLPRAAVIRVGAGRLWLTRPGHADDVWLTTDGSWTAPERATVWVSAEPSADFQIASPAPAPARGIALETLRWLYRHWMPNRSLA